MAYRNKLISNPVNGQSIKFLQTTKDTAGELLEMEASWQPHSHKPADHYHPFQDEHFRVITGELMVKMNGQIKLMKAGDQVHINKNIHHAMWNDSNDVTVVNWRVFPALNTEYLLETAIGLANDGKLNKKGMSHTLQIALIGRQYADEFRLSKPPFLIQKILFTILRPFARLAGIESGYKNYID
ncbi:MAG: cupin domain-containing protein [Flavisolibacter sp.]